MCNFAMLLATGIIPNPYFFEHLEQIHAPLSIDICYHTEFSWILSKLVCVLQIRQASCTFPARRTHGWHGLVVSHYKFISDWSREISMYTYGSFSGTALCAGPDTPHSLNLFLPFRCKRFTMLFLCLMIYFRVENRQKWFRWTVWFLGRPWFHLLHLVWCRLMLYWCLRMRGTFDVKRYCWMLI